MKKFLYVVLGLIVLIIAAVFLGPLFIDGDKYRSEIEAKFKETTGYDIAIKGDVSLKVFPRVQASVGDISIFNGNTNIANINKITVYPLVNTLFKDKILIDNVTVDGMTATLEKNESANNWTIKTRAVSPTATHKLDLQIDKINITNSKLDYADKIKNKNYSFENIAGKLNLASFAGPVDFDGSLNYKKTLIAGKGTLTDFAAPKLKATATVLGTAITYEGTRDGGQFSIKSADIDPFLDFAGYEETARQLAKQTIDIAGHLDYSPDASKLADLRLLIGNTKGSGDISLQVGDRMNIISNFKFQNLDLDQLLPSNMFAQPKEVSNTGVKNKEVDAELDISAATITFGKMQYKNLVVKSTSENHTVSVQPLSIDFPKNGHAEMFGVLSDDTQGRIFEGHVTADSKNLPEVLQSMRVMLPEHKAGSLESFNLDSEVVVNFREHPSADLSDARLTVDQTSFRGNISLDFDKTTSLVMNGAMGEIDLDKYLLADDKTAAATQRDFGPTDEKPLEINWLNTIYIKASADLVIPKIIFRQEPYSNVRLRATLQKQALEIGEVSFSGRKIQLAGKGALYTFDGKKPKLTVNANLGKTNIDDFIDLAPEPATRPADKNRWSKDPIDLSILRKIDVEFKGTIQSFIHHRFIFDNMTVQGYVEKNKLFMEKAAGDMYGGKVDLNGTVEASAVPIISLSYNGVDVDIKRLLTAVADITRVSGKANFSGSISTSGIFQLNMINNLKGSVSVLANNIVVKGFDLDGMAQQLTNTNNLADVVSIARTVSGDQAVTYIKSLGGTITAENGIATNQGQGIELNIASGKGYYSGRGDLVNWNMDTTAAFRLWTADRKESPELSIRIFGSISEPSKDVNLDAIKRYISTRSAKLLLNGNGLQNPTQPPAH